MTKMTHYNNKEALESARLQHLVTASKSSLITNILLAAIVAFIQRDVIASEIVITWFSLILIITIIRKVLIIRYQSSQLDNYPAIRAKLIEFRFGVLTSAVVWGYVGSFMFSISDQQHQMFLIFVLAGLSAGGMIAFSADYISTTLHSVAVLIPLIFNLFIDKGSLSLAMGTAGLLYLGFIILNSKQINKNQIKNIVLSLEALEKERQILHHANNLELNNNILNLINQHKSLPTILNTLVLHFESLHPSMFCSILLLDHDTQTLRTIAAPNLPNFYNKAINGLKIGESVGSCGTAAFLGKSIVIDDIQQHPYWTQYRDLARKAGLRSCWSYPLKNKDGLVLGTFAIYQNKKLLPSENELSLIADYTNLTLLAIESNSAQNNLNLSAIAFQSQDAIVIMDANKKILQANNSFSKMTGYSEKELKGKILGMNIPKQLEVNLYSSIWKGIEDKDVVKSEFDSYRMNGEAYSVEVIITKVKDSNGIASNYVASFQDNTLSKAAAEEIKTLAFYDTLTKLPNRQLLSDRLNHLLATMARNGKSGALLFIDLDHFKTLNDSLGHHIGDLLLQQVAKRLTTNIRECDSAARFGGDEYVVLLENLSDNIAEASKQTESITTKLLAVLNQPYQLADNLYRITASIGVTVFNDQHQSLEDLLKHADIAMYEAKKEGRNNLRFFNPQMQQEIKDHIKLKNDLNSALEQKQFQLYYQSQTDQFGNIIGAEALIRWCHPEQGLVSPGYFIPIAEESGLILPIGKWVLDTACAQLKAWQLDTASCNLSLSINVSANQFQEKDFVKQVCSAVKHYGINPNLLKLELTESILLESIDNTIQTMNTLNEIGIRFALDDFGTGYSSLQYLKLLPLYQLKIDRSFIQDIVIDSDDKAIVQTIIAMAKAMDLEAIAEGVETEEQLNILRNKGCLKFQGYLFDKPAPIEEFNALLKKKTTPFQNALKVINV